MGKRSKRNSGPREGSRRAEKIAQRNERLAELPPKRPFEGLAAECDLVALREFVPSATAPLPLVSNEAGRSVTLATVLPGAVAALVRDQSGDTPPECFVGLQLAVHSGNPARDVAVATEWVTTATPGTSLSQATIDAESPNIADVIAADKLLDIEVHGDFNWWLANGSSTGELPAAVQRANELIMPSARLDADGIVAAWWVDAGEKAHLRWVRPEDEDSLMRAMARLHAREHLTLGEGSRFAGSFRTHGLLVPVFDLDPDRHHEEWVSAASTLQERLEEALNDDSAFTLAERRARDGIIGRQVTLR
ncbi:hypothetical protein IEU95_11285 [Hoyosella rhizosphaerae]|uniref:DUF5926 domain-containing protein n=1 Tax=Hoyosella rhizosphaerae TaxID=1755582 RepID=A0A916UB39_9ACTN|nr:DUF5926 family protein [Hoyosella rhizosphaerae]MBN4927417.1 hypothetical protein [Hoyosella rhizosphaerae]GGC64564.1 hypothetical protein GCM10011410_16380 [Hoyosella rhizosphaerae]